MTINYQKKESINLPALKEVFEHVLFAKNSKGYYTKHTAHTKSSTKGCVMGCIYHFCVIIVLTTLSIFLTISLTERFIDFLIGVYS